MNATTPELTPEPKRIDLMSEHAKEKARLPADWKAYRYACGRKAVGDEVTYYEIEGKVCNEIYADGPRKGDTNWDLGDPSTKAVVCLDKQEHLEWVKAWEIKTGLCAECVGTGRTIQGWNHITGLKYRVCGICRGSGKRRA